MTVGVDAPQLLQELDDVPDQLILRCHDLHDDREYTVTLHGGSILAGRHCKLRISTQADLVSQVHARFEWDAKTQSWRVKDLGSSNGTKRAGKKLKTGTRFALKSGDNLLLGDSLSIQVEVRLMPWHAKCHSRLTSCPLADILPHAIGSTSAFLCRHAVAMHALWNHAQAHPALCKHRNCMRTQPLRADCPLRSQHHDSKASARLVH